MTKHVGRGELSMRPTNTARAVHVGRDVSDKNQQPMLRQGMLGKEAHEVRPTNATPAERVGRDAVPENQCGYNFQGCFVTSADGFHDIHIFFVLHQS